MAEPVTSTFGDFLIEYGDGGGPEVFALLCGLRSKTFGFQNNYASTPVPDCADEDLPAFEQMAVASQTAPLSGSGVFPAEHQKLLLEWARDGVTKNIRVYPGKSPATGDIQYYEGPAFLSLTLTGERGPRMTADMEFAFSTKPVPTLIP